MRSASSPSPRHARATAVIAALLLAATLPAVSGCAVVMAAKQPSKKNLNILAPGTPRALLIAEFGAPIHAETKEGKRIEVYSFRQGYSKAARVSRAIGHGAADVFTLGLWEVVGTPTEAVFDGREMVVQVTLDAGEKVETAVMLKK